MIDGIRLNNSTFRYGPNQYLNTINVDQIDRIEVLRGSGSVQYGSDALGGVVHIITKTPQIGLSKPLSYGLQMKYISDDMEKSANAYINYSSSNSGYSASLSFKKYGDLVAGNNLGLEAPSSYDEYSFNIKNLHMISEKVLITYNYQYLKQSDIDRFDQVNQRGYDYYKFDPQIRQLAYIKSEGYSLNKFAKKISLTLSWQQSSESRKTKKSEENLRTTEKDVVDTWGASFTVFSQLQKNWVLNSGLEYYFDYVQSNSTEFNLTDNSQFSKRGLYSDASQFHNFSLFSLSKIKIEEFDIGLGARYNLASLVIKDELFGEPKIFPHAFTGFLSLSYNVIKNLKFVVNLNSAYRIPNINDVSSFGKFDYGIEVPNINLSPERAINYEAGIKLNLNNVTGSVFLFRSDLINLIDRVKTTYMGDETIDGETVYTKDNIGEAFIRGIEFDLGYSLLHNLILENNFTYTYGQNTSGDEPMRRIPPANGSISLLYGLNENLQLRIQYLYAY